MSRILIADDDPGYLNSFIDAMEAVGHEVTGVSSGDEAVSQMQASEYDIIFLDVVMAGGGAISTLHRVRAIDETVPVVVITGRPEMMDSPLFLNGLRMSQAQLQKTASLEELAEVVRRLTWA